MSKIAFDFDGVICDSTNIILSAIRKLHNYNLSPNDVTEYEIKVPGVSKKELSETIRYGLTNYWMYAAPTYNAIVTLNEYYKSSKEPVLIISARDEEHVGEATLKWCNLHFNFPYKFVFLAKHEKLECIMDEKIDVFVEDRYETADELSKHLKKVYLFTQPWNTKYNNDKICRINNLSDIFKEGI